MSNSSFNAIEVHFAFDNKYNISEKKYNEIIQFLKQKPSKHISHSFQKTVYKECCQDLIFQQTYDTFNDFNDKNKPSKEIVYTSTRVSPQNEDSKFHNILKKNTNLFFIQNKSLPLFSFPSTTCLFASSVDQRISYKVNNKIYLNFNRIQYNNDSNIYHFVNMNYQNFQNTDIDDDIALINSIIECISNKFP
jgi:hypothetical protein